MGGVDHNKEPTHVFLTSPLLEYHMKSLYSVNCFLTYPITSKDYIIAFGAMFEQNVVLVIVTNLAQWKRFCAIFATYNIHIKHYERDLNHLMRCLKYSYKMTNLSRAN